MSHLYIKNPKRLSVPRPQRALTLYPATDCAAATDISGVSGRWQLSRDVYRTAAAGHAR